MRSLNTCREKRSAKYWLVVNFLAGLILACAFGKVYALDPNRAMSQYTRDFWNVEKGFPSGTVYAFAQTPDGYLWIGSEKGLIRFDGLKFETIQPADTLLSAAEPVLGLLTDADGSLWIRLRSPKIIRYRHGKFEDATANLNQIDPRIILMSRGNKGDILVSTLENGPLKYGEKGFTTVVPKPELPNSFVISVAESETGDIWMGTREAGLYKFSGGRTFPITNNLPDRKINYLLPDGGNLWIGTDKGIVRWNGVELVTPEMPEAVKSSQILTMFKDRQSNIWIGTESKGLVRLNAAGETAIEKIGDASNKMISAIFEDREGNLWVGSPNGIERFRDNAFMTYSVNEGLPSDSSGALYVDATMKIWFAPLNGGLYWLKNNQTGSVENDGLGTDIVYSITGGDKDLWIGRQRGGLTHLQFNNGNPTTKTYTQTDGLAQNSVYTVYQSRDGTVWAGTLSGGASRFQNGKFTTYTTADGLASNAVTDIAESADGTVWFAAPNGLSSLAKDNWRTYAVKDGLPTEKVNCLLADSGGVLWLGTAKGLAFFTENRIHFNPNMPISLREPMLGLAEDKSGSIWVTTTNRVLQVNREKLLNGTLVEADVREFGIPDGLAGIEGVKRSRSVAADALGRIWFSMNRGISVVDAGQLKNNSVPAIVHITDVSADNVRLELQNSVRISAAHQRITIEFAGLNLSMPERVRFRYRLEGFDGDWSEPTANSEAIYTNLSPGSYRFRVTASSGDNLWNSGEAIVILEIEPLFWQTWWFRLLCLLAAALMLLGLYRVRLRHLTGQLNLRFEERLAERTRIAQELHDSLLQGFVGASMQLDVAIDRLPEDSPAKSKLTHVLEMMRRVTEEGRNTVRGLRSSHTDDSTSLEQAFYRFRQDFPANDTVNFRVIVEGSPRPLHPLVRDEVYRIGCEALVNAFRHSKADKIEIEIAYAANFFKITVRDDGCGIDAKILRSGREGHWGLSGMRERAEKIGAHLKLWSRAAAGTEVELSVAAHTAYDAQFASRPRRWLNKLSFREPRIPYSKGEQNR